MLYAHDGDTNLIHRCVRSHSGQLRIVGANETCKPTETSLDWNIMGLAGPAGATGPSGPAAMARRFYLTQAQHQGNAALNACATGFHMASLWEIFHMSVLRYDTSLGWTQPDSGAGPPTGTGGWVRTGGFDSVSGESGTPTCNVWASNSPLDQGTIVGLLSGWGMNLISPIIPWGAVSTSIGNISCNQLRPVWCVED